MVYPIAKYIMPPIYKLWIRKVEGVENFPANQPFIIAANHTSYYDTILPHTILIPRLNKQIRALVNSRYWNNIITIIILNWGKCIPVYVGKDYDAKKNKMAIAKGVKYLRQGDLIQIFPEGTRSYDGKLKKGHNGVAKLAIKSKAPVIPVGIIDSDKVLPKGKFLPRFARCDIKIGKPMHFNKYYNKKLNNKDFDKITRSIMKEIAKLIGQKYNY